MDLIPDLNIWTELPFHFWSVVYFVVGTIVGSFLNVCIHRLPAGESLVSPPSHCPHCQASIHWYQNIPILSWLWLRGRCASCAEPISSRYVWVEALTGILFLASWLWCGGQSVGLALAYCLILAGFLVATFIDLAHFIIPDEITLGGIAVGFLTSFAVPELHEVSSRSASLTQSFIGILVGGGLIYTVLQLGKLFFGRHRFRLEPDSQVVFTETSLQLADEEIPYHEIFSRNSDRIRLDARQIVTPDRCYPAARVALSPRKLQIGEDAFDPAEVTELRMIAEEITLPREAMGFGDVKFMAAIGAFLGWQASIFSLMMSSIIGATIGVILILLKKHEWSSQIPYGPYIAAAATVWMFGGNEWVEWWLTR